MIEPSFRGVQHCFRPLTKGPTEFCEHRVDLPKAKSIGASNVMLPRYRVAVQLKTLIAEGTATIKDKNENTTFA